VPAPSDNHGMRAVGALGATAIVAGSMLGVGIFLTPRLVALQVSSTGPYLLLWALGGIVALAGAVAYAELGTMFPRAGGDYVYLRHAFGPSTGFASGWLLFAGVFCGSISSMASAVCTYQLSTLAAPLIELDLAAPALGTLSGSQLAAITLVLGLTVLNCLGVRASTMVQTLATLVPFAVLTVVAVYALATEPHTAAVAAPADTGEPWSVAGLAVAFLGVYFAYAGWNAVAYVGGEIDRPERNIPLSLLGGAGLVTLLYLLLCAAFVAVLGIGGLRNAFEAGTASATALLGPGAEWWVAALIAVALLGSVNATVLQGSRIAYAMATDGSLHPWFAALGSTTAVPVRSLWAQALVSCLLIATGSFDALIELTSVAMLVMGGLAVLSLFVLRRREPDRARPYRATGYPVVPALYLAVSATVIVSRCWQAWLSSTRPDADALEWFPLLGLALFVVMLVGHSLARRVTTGAGSSTEH